MIHVFTAFTTANSHFLSVGSKEEFLLVQHYRYTMPIQPDLLAEELFHLEEEERGLLSMDQPGVPVDDTFWSHLDQDAAEKLLTKEMETMSLVEHEKILFDIHGIALVDEDDPADLPLRLEQVETEIQKIRRKPAYDRAKYFDEAYVQGDSFRLRFLRSDYFRSTVAAQRIVRHFQIKQELFGDGPILARDIVMSDLLPEDLRALESGFVQILPARDAAGRSIVSIAPMHRPENCSVESCVSSQRKHCAQMRGVASKLKVWLTLG